MNALNDIRALVVRHGIGRVELAEAAGVTPATVQRLLDDADANPTLETLSKMKAGIDRVLSAREAAAAKVLAERWSS